MSKRPLPGTIDAELRYQLKETALAISAADGGHELMILAEQFDTIARFLDHPDAIKEQQQIVVQIHAEQLMPGRRYLR